MVGCLHFQVGDMWRTVFKTTLITVPVTVAALDVFGYVARVEGASMQVSFFGGVTTHCSGCEACRKRIGKPRLHDTTCCQTGCQTRLTTGCIV